MLQAPTPDNESERIASLRKMLLLSSPDEAAFDRITRIAQQVFAVPIALVSLIDEQRQWFKSCIGLPVRETGRDVSFCGHAILDSEIFVIEDSRLDARFADNPLVVSEPHVIFYAGRPLRNPEGFLVGTLCIIDHEPRQFDAAARQALDDLGHWVESVFLSRALSEVQQLVLLERDEAERTRMLDPMLNIWNRAPAMDILNREVLRNYHQSLPLSLLLIDIDQLAEINQRYGQAVGDAVLIELAKVLGSSTRAYDTVARYVDDTFISILPGADARKALKIGEKIRHGTELILWPSGDDVIEISVCIGVLTVNYPEITPEMDQLLEWVERALAQAKSAGRGSIKVLASTDRN